jgi:hypothetical protein
VLRDRQDILRRRTTYPNHRDHQEDDNSSNRQPHHPFLTPLKKIAGVIEARHLTHSPEKLFQPNPGPDSRETSLPGGTS